MPATIHNSLGDVSAPFYLYDDSGNGHGNLLEILAYALGKQPGWTVELAPDPEDAARTHLDITPAAGSAPRCRITRAAEPQDEPAYYTHRFDVPDARVEQGALLGFPDTRAAIVANLTNDLPWDTALSEDDFLAVFAENQLESGLPPIYYDNWTPLPQTVKDKIAANLTAGDPWHDGLSSADAQAIYNVWRPSPNIFALASILPSAIVNKIIANYLSGRDVLYGLAPTEIVTVLDAAGVSYDTAGAPAPPPVSGWAAALEPALLAAIRANIQASAPWHQGLSAADLAAVLAAAEVSYALGDFESLPWEGMELDLPEFYRAADNGAGVQTAWIVIADDKSFMLFIGCLQSLEVNDIGDTAESMAYAHCLSYGTLGNPAGGDWFVWTGNEWDYGLRVGRHIEDDAYFSLDYYLSDSGSGGYGLGRAKDMPWVSPLFVALHDIRPGQEYCLGILPFAEFILNHVDAARHTALEAIAQNRYLLPHVHRGYAAGMLILRTAEIPLYSMA